MHPSELYPEEGRTWSVDDTVLLFISSQEIKITYVEWKSMHFALQFTLRYHLTELGSCFDGSHHVNTQQNTDFLPQCSEYEKADRQILKINIWEKWDIGKELTD